MRVPDKWVWAEKARETLNQIVQLAENADKETLKQLRVFAGQILEEEQRKEIASVNNIIDNVTDIVTAVAKEIKPDSQFVNYFAKEQVANRAIRRIRTVRINDNADGIKRLIPSMNADELYELMKEIMTTDYPVENSPRGGRFRIMQNPERHIIKRIKVPFIEGTRFKE